MNWNWNWLIGAALCLGGFSSVAEAISNIRIDGRRSGREFVFEIPHELRMQGVEFAKKDVSLSSIDGEAVIFHCFIDGKLVGYLLGRVRSEELIGRELEVGQPLTTMPGGALLQKVTTVAEDALEDREKAAQLHQKAAEVAKKALNDFAAKVKMPSEQFSKCSRMLEDLQKDTRLTSVQILKRVLLAWAAFSGNAIPRQSYHGQVLPTLQRRGSSLQVQNALQAGYQSLVECILRYLETGDTADLPVFLQIPALSQLPAELATILREVLNQAPKGLSLDAIRRHLEQQQAGRFKPQSTVSCARRTVESGKKMLLERTH